MTEWGWWRHSFSLFLLKYPEISSNWIPKRTFPKRNKFTISHNQGKQTRKHLQAFSCPYRSNLFMRFNQ
jgi:hypothetical protein